MVNVLKIVAHASKNMIFTICFRCRGYHSFIEREVFLRRSRWRRISFPITQIEHVISFVFNGQLNAKVSDKQTLFGTKHVMDTTFSSEIQINGPTKYPQRIQSTRKGGDSFHIILMSFRHQKINRTFESVGPWSVSFDMATGHKLLLLLLYRRLTWGWNRMKNVFYNE